MYFVKVYVTYKESVLDPQGETVKGAIHRLGYEEFDSIRIGKYMEVQVQPSTRPVQEAVEEVCDKLLANVNTETYRYEIFDLEQEGALVVSTVKDVSTKQTSERVESVAKGSHHLGEHTCGCGTSLPEPQTTPNNSHSHCSCGCSGHIQDQHTGKRPGRGVGQ